MDIPHRFVASAAGVHEDDDCLVATLDSGADSYLMFQRHPDFGCDDDDGVYVEIDDQSNAGFNIVADCAATSTTLMVNLTSALKGHAEIQATLDLPAQDIVTFLAMLRRIFTGCDDLLTIEA